MIATLKVALTELILAISQVWPNPKWMSGDNLIREVAETS